jgi:hypothetical protein
MDSRLALVVLLGCASLAAAARAPHVLLDSSAAATSGVDNQQLWAVKLASMSGASIDKKAAPKGERVCTAVCCPCTHTYTHPPQRRAAAAARARRVPLRPAHPLVEAPTAAASL